MGAAGALGEEETGGNQQEATANKQSTRPRLCASAFLAAHLTAVAAACLGSLFIHLF